MNEPEKRGLGFWPIFFIVFFLEIVALVLAIGVAATEAPLVFFWLILAIVPGVTLIIGLTKASQNKPASQYILASILAPLAFFIVGAGACFLILSGMNLH